RSLASRERSELTFFGSATRSCATRTGPAVQRELPPDSSSGARSRTRILFTASEAESAAHSAALPAPTTITSYACVTWIGSLSPARRGGRRAAPTRTPRRDDGHGP